MSLAALLIATRNTIRDGLGIDPTLCRVMPGPRPPAVAGEEFIAVHGADWSAGDYDLNIGIDENYSVSVTLTTRSCYVPHDDHSEELYLKAITGLENRARSLIKLIHLNNDLMGSANLLITSGDYKIIEPLRFQNADAAPTYVDSSWFSSDGKEPFAGMVLGVNFSGARRKQSYIDRTVVG